MKNLQGDVLEVYNEDHSCVASYTYDSWGNVLTKSGSLADINPFRYRSYYYDNESWFYYLQSRYYDPAIGRFINADDVDLLGANGDFSSLNLFAYCGSNPICRIDDSGELWGTAIATIGISSVASVVVSAISAIIHKEDFSVGDAVGAAIEGAAAAAMTIVGVPAVLANPAATFCGSVIGKYIDGDFSKEAAYEILEDTGKTVLSTVAFSSAGMAVSKYSDVYLSGKYADLNAAEKLIKNIAYQPKFLNKRNIHTVISDNFMDSARALAIEVVW